MPYEIKDNGRLKCMASSDVNYIFDRETGFSAVWGKTKAENPDWCQYGPLIADIEITTQCKGPAGKLCKFCYKANNPQGENMSLDTFKEVFKRLPNTLQQIAFGVDAQCESNPDVFAIMQHCRDNGVIPNVTVADINDDTAAILSTLCGAVAVSRYDDKGVCYDSVQQLTNYGMDQVNIHMMVSEETYEQALETINDIQSDTRLESLNAIVFLSLKKKGRGTEYTPLGKHKFKRLVDLCLEKGISFGFDSCSAMKFLEAVKTHKLYERFLMVSEPCESARFSAYINVRGEYFPCSFVEGEPFYYGVKVTDFDDFMDIWESDSNKVFRLQALDHINNGVGCQEFKI